jgi:hypothetical protein
MTECCLFVCCRPSTSSRLISSLYPKDTTGYEEKLVPLKLKRLIEYILSYPKKLKQICEILERNIVDDYRHDRIGYVLIGMETFRGICKECSFQTDILETVDIYLIRCFNLLFSSQNIKYLELAYPIFLDYTDCNVETSFSHFLPPILQLCQPFSSSSSSSSEKILLGLKYLYRIIGILTPSSGELEKHLPTFLPLFFYFYSHGAGGKSNNGMTATSGRRPFEVEPTNEIFVDDDGTLTPHDLSASCLELLLQNPSPTTSSHVLRLLFRVWDRQLWEPIEAISSCLVRFHRLLGFSSHHHPSLASLLTSHAYLLLTDPTIPVPQPNPSVTMSVAYHFPLPVSVTPSFQMEQSPTTTLGSEYLIRTFPRRSQLIRKILNLLHDIYSSQEHSRTTPHVTFTTLSSERMLEHLSSDESIVTTLCHLLEFLSRQWGDETLLLRNLPELVTSPEISSSAEQTPTPSLGLPLSSTSPPSPLPSVELFPNHTTPHHHLHEFLLEFINTTQAQLPINFCKRDRIHDTTPSHSEISESCHHLFVDILKCLQAMIPTLPSAKSTVSLLLYFNEAILSCDQSTGPVVIHRKAISPLSQAKAEKIYRLLLLFSLHTTLRDFLLKLTKELHSHGITDFSLHNLTQQRLHTHLSNYLTPLCSHLSSISPSPYFHLNHHPPSSCSSPPSPPSSSLPHLLVYILLSSQQLCQYITLFTNTSLTLNSPSTSPSTTFSESILLQILLSTVISEIISLERLVTFLFTLLSHEKAQQFHPTVLSLISYHPHSSAPPLPPHLPAAATATTVGYVVISQRNQILRDFIFHQLCSQTNNVPDASSPPSSPWTGRIFLCKVQMMWNIQVTSPLPPHLLSDLCCLSHLCSLHCHWSPSPLYPWPCTWRNSVKSTHCNSSPPLPPPHLCTPTSTWPPLSISSPPSSPS